MKKIGDRHRNVALSMNDMIGQMVSDLTAANDARFQRLWQYDPIPTVKRWLARSKQTNVLVGANKSTKTTMGVVKAIAVYTGIIPPAMRACWNHAALVPAHRPRHVRIIVQDYTKHWPETIRPLLMDDDEWGMLPEIWAKNYNPDQHMFYGPDGSYLSIVAIDPKQGDEDRIANTLRGPIIDHTYIDELQRRAVYTESLTRNATARDGPATVDLGFCPQEGYDWTYDALYLMGYSKDDRELPEAEQNPSVNVLRVSMRDNPSVSDEAIQNYLNVLKPWEIAYRVDGKYSARAGDPYFDMDQLEEWRRAGICSAGVHVELVDKVIDIEEGVFQGRMVPLEGRIDEYRHNIWQLWEHPKPGEYYIMTIDTAEGHKESDFQNADIWRCSRDGNIASDYPVQVAQLHKRKLKPGDFIEECCVMATIWGEILIAYEVNNTSGGTVRDRSRNYCNLYNRADGKREVEKGTEYLGWYTDVASKPAALEQAYGLTRIWKDGNVGLRSPITLGEMMSFEEKIKRNAKTHAAVRIFQPSGSGLHDDTITTLYIMAYILRFQNHWLTASQLSDMPDSKGYESKLEKQAQAAGHNENKRFAFLKKKPSFKQSVGRHGR